MTAATPRGGAVGVVSGRASSGSSSAPLVLVVIGTRPEAIKLAPVIAELRRRPSLRTAVCVTAQHRLLADEALRFFGIEVDHDLDVMRDRQSPSGVAAAVLTGLHEMFQVERPDVVLVEGDTTTVLAASIAAFHAGIPIAHVEAGLRSNDMHDPFPEEANRRIASLLATIHFAPTEWARQNLLREGVADDAIVVTGNPGIDALHMAIASGADTDGAKRNGARILLATVHRRESFGPPLDAICRALRRIAALRRDVRIVLPVHPNPVVRGPVETILGDMPNVELVAPMNYQALTTVLRRCYLVLTDSGGLQEEAPALGKPVLVMRDTTERPEGIQAGAAVLVGRAIDSIVLSTLRLLDDPALYAAMAVPRPIYGDGQAATRIVDALIARLAAADLSLVRGGSVRKAMRDARVTIQ